MRIKDEKGYILVAVLVIGLLVAIIGFAASKMTDLGTATYGGQKKYEIAAAAAEYAVNQAINHISLVGACPTSTTSQMTDSNAAAYQYLGNQAGGYCFIRGQGMFRDAKVVKTVVVPDTSDFDYGALTMRYGGATATSGSSAIMNCDDECKSPAIVYGNTLTFTANLDKSSCKKGIYAVGVEGIQSGAGIECTASPCSGPTLSDRIPKIFNTPSWGALQDRLDGTYNGHTVDVSTLSVSDTPPTVPSNCQCAGSVVLGATSTCSGAAWNIPGACTSVQGTSITVNSLPAGVTTVYSASSTATDKVTINGNISNATIIGQNGVSLASGMIENSTITTTGTGAGVTMTNANTNNSTIVTSGQFYMDKNSGTVTDTNIFAGSALVKDQGGNCAGGLIYTQGDFVFDGTTSGNNNFGTIDKTTMENSKPVLMIIGGDMDMNKMTGTTEINGLVFIEGALKTDGAATGNFSITGAVITNSDNKTSAFNAKGNATLSFNHKILDMLSTKTALNGLVKQTACGGTFGRNAFISNSKVTVF
jgi:Tfp pilus assembly protein PilX